MMAMIRITEWENGYGCTMELDKISAEILRDTLAKALTNETHRYNAVGDIYEIDVEIIND